MNAPWSDVRREVPRAYHPAFRATWSILVMAMLVIGFGAAQAQEGLNVEEVFWCEEPESEEDMSLEACHEARDIALFECTACHAPTPFVQAQKTPEAWDATFEAHADRISHLDDEEIALIKRFMVTHYNPDEPVPELPESLQQQSTNQAF